MRMLLEIDGLKELIAKMEQAKSDVPLEIEMGMYEALEPVKQDTTTYPTAQSHVNPRYTYIRGVGTQYITTGGAPGRIYRTSEKYGQTQSISVTKTGSTVEGSLNTGASYWRYLRGDLDGYDGAWMHIGKWEPIRAIVERHLPRITALFEKRVAQWFDRR